MEDSNNNPSSASDDDDMSTCSESSSTCEKANEESSPPAPKANIREVKHKTLALLTELYRTESGDVKRMAMSLLQTLYTIEEDQVGEMNGKVVKLMKLIEEQKREQAELEEASLAGTASQDGSIGGGGFFFFTARSRAHTEESNLSTPDYSIKLTTSSLSASPKEEADTTSVSSSSAIKENNLIKKWQEKLDFMRKPEPKVETEKEEESETTTSNTPPPTVQLQQLKESITTKIDASRERLTNGLRESTTKLQQTLQPKAIMVEAKPTEEEEDSVSTEGSSTPSSPNGSNASTPSSSSEPKPDDLMNVFRTLAKNGIDSKQSRESIELAYNARKEKARNRWAETRAKWKWAKDNNNNTSTEAQA